MASSLTTIEFQRGDTPQRLFVAGASWLTDGLRRRLSGATIEPPDDGPHDFLIAERNCLSLVSDARIGQIPSVLMIDPEPHEHRRVMAIKAGNPRARVRPLPSYAAIGAAEQALLLILALRRTLLMDYSAVVSGEWTGESHSVLLARQTLGVIGLGRSGEALASRAIGLGMRVLYHDVESKEDVEARLSVARRRFDQLLRQSDVVSLHLPATVETIRLIDAPELALMKPNALLINVADGRLIDGGSLLKALRAGAIGGAGLDRFAYEPLSTDSPLIGFENVVLTPRSAWMSADDEREIWLHEMSRDLIGET